MTIISTTVGKNPLEEMEQPSIVNKKIQNAIFGCSLKMTEWSRLISKKNLTTPQYHYHLLLHPTSVLYLLSHGRRPSKPGTTQHRATSLYSLDHIISATEDFELEKKKTKQKPTIHLKASTSTCGLNIGLEATSLIALESYCPFISLRAGSHHSLFMGEER